MEIIKYTYTLSLLDSAYGKITFKENNGKVKTKDYEINKIVGGYLVKNVGTKYLPELKVYRIGGKY